MTDKNSNRVCVFSPYTLEVTLCQGLIGSLSLRRLFGHSHDWDRHEDWQEEAVVDPRVADAIVFEEIERQEQDPNLKITTRRGDSKIALTPGIFFVNNLYQVESCVESCSDKSFGRRPGDESRELKEQRASGADSADANDSRRPNLSWK